MSATLVSREVWLTAVRKDLERKPKDDLLTLRYKKWTLEYLELAELADPKKFEFIPGDIKLHTPADIYRILSERHHVCVAILNRAVHYFLGDTSRRML